MKNLMLYTVIETEVFDKMSDKKLMLHDIEQYHLDIYI